MRILTAALIEKGKSARGAWSKKQLDLLGVPWPLKKGWKRRLIGKSVSETDLDEFLNLKNAHLKKKPLPTAQIEPETRKLASDMLDNAIEVLAEEGITGDEFRAFWLHFTKLSMQLISHRLRCKDCGEMATLDKD